MASSEWRIGTPNGLFAIRYWKGRRDETRGRRRRPRPIGRDARLHLAPGYNNGNAPYGVFNWADARVPTSWINNGDIPSDICVIRLQNDTAGHPVTYYTG